MVEQKAAPGKSAESNMQHISPVLSLLAYLGVSPVIIAGSTQHFGCLSDVHRLSRSSPNMMN